MNSPQDYKKLTEAYYPPPSSAEPHNAYTPSSNYNGGTVGGYCMNQPWSFERTAYDQEMLKRNPF